MKIPHSLFEAMPQALLDVFKDGRPADKVIEFYGKNNKKWGSRDRRFFAEVVYEIVRHYRQLWVRCGFERNQYLEPRSLTISKLQQIVFLYLSENKPDNPAPMAWSVKPVSIDMTSAEKESYPDWFDGLGKQELGENWESVAQSLNEKAPVYLRVNTLKAKRSQVAQSLRDEGIETETCAGSEIALKLTERKNVFITKAFLQGWFEVQDLSSQKVAPLLNPLPGERVVDACAGAGGKTLHIASLMQNKGKIIAMDITERKLEELRKRASRGGVSLIETRVIESTKTIKRLEATADALLLDVPCSGSGVIRRNPSTKWNFSVEDWNRLLQTQSEILEQDSKIVKPKGRMVYATCSVFPSENEKQVEAFVKRHPEWQLTIKKTVLPDREEGDGFFMALLEKNGG